MIYWCLLNTFTMGWLNNIGADTSKNFKVNEKNFLFQHGRCGDCVAGKGTCYKHSQCCKGLYCSKGWAKFKGRCHPAKDKGGVCNQKPMCKKDCKKKWYQIKGKCT